MALADCDKNDSPYAYYKNYKSKKETQMPQDYDVIFWIEQYLTDNETPVNIKTDEFVFASDFDPTRIP